MNGNAYRKAALDRLASPEQLDEALRMTAAKEWIGILAILLVLGAVAVWAIKGALPVKVKGQGVIIRTGGVLTVSTLHGGMILAVNVKVGDKIRARQVIARVAQPALVEKIRALGLEVLQAQRDSERAMTVARHDAKLRIEALELQRANAVREMEEIEKQSRLAAEQIPVQEHLLARGLVTKQQTIAARQKLVSLEQQMAAHRAAIKEYAAQEFAIQAKPEQSDAEWTAQIRRLQTQRAYLEKELATSENVVSPYSGEVIEMKVEAGGVVQPESPILSVQPDVRNLEVLVCVPSRFAKGIAAGMQAEVSPSPVKREEFGFIRASVAHVADYPATSASLMRTFQNDALVRSLTADGPVTEVRVQMVEDAATITGFRWSSSKGPPLTISSGSLCAVEITTRQQRPIELLLPSVKKTLGLI